MSDLIYERDGYRIASASVCEIDEIGDWQSYLGGDEVTYAADRGEGITYACDFIALYHHKTIIGYAIAIPKNVLAPLSYANAGDRVYDILDLSIDAENALELLSWLFAYLCEKAKESACTVLRVKQSEANFTAFYRFCLADMRMEQGDGCLLLNLGTAPDADYLALLPKAGDAVGLSEMLLLFALHFSIGEEICTLFLRQGKITVSRRDGTITYPSYVRNEGEPPSFLKETDRRALCYLAELDQSEGVAHVILHRRYTARGGQTLTVGMLHGDCAVFLGDEEGYDAVWGEDTPILHALIRDGGVRFIAIPTVGFNPETEEFSVDAPCRELSSVACSIMRVADAQHKNLIAIKGIREREKAFGVRLHTLTRFALILDGNYLIFTRADGVLEISDGRRAHLLHGSADEEFLLRLSRLCFTNLKSEYKGDGKCSWRMELSFEEGDALTFRGDGDVPRIWEFVLDLYDDYVSYLK